MSEGMEACHECGCQAAAEELVRKRIQEPKRKGTGKVFRQVYLCHECAAKHTEVAFVKAGRVCDQCGTRLGRGEGVLRSRTETEVAGVVARHQTQHLILCAQCAESHDRTGSHILMTALVFFAGLVVLACMGWFFSGMR